MRQGQISVLSCAKRADVVGIFSTLACDIPWLLRKKMKPRRHAYLARDVTRGKCIIAERYR